MQGLNPREFKHYEVRKIRQNANREVRQKENQVSVEAWKPSKVLQGRAVAWEQTALACMSDN